MSPRIRIIVFSLSGLILLILDGTTARIGILEGMKLCMNTLIPSLFPFCVLSALLTGSLVSQPIPILKPICKFCRIPPGFESLLLIGWLGGYPIGAQNVAAAHRSGFLTSEDATRMAIICNNAGPSFLFGILGPIIPGKYTVWMLWGILLCSSLLTAHLIPGGKAHPGSLPQQELPAFPTAIRTGIVSMANICANVLFMRMILEFITKWVLSDFSNVFTALISGILEVSNGCIQLAEIKNSTIQCMIASTLLSFGGICVWMQTRSVCYDMDLKGYLKWKLFQSILALCLTAATLYPCLLVLVIPMLSRYLILRFFKK